MSGSLIADIGGTKSRFALASSAGRPEHIVVIDNDTVPDLESAIASYLEQTGVRAETATLAIAGPVDGEEVRLTNRPWLIRRGELARRFGFSQLRLLNDFEAIAWALPRLTAADTRSLGPPIAPRAGVKLVLGPGTGLGVAALLPVAGGWQVMASEGGHASFGPQAADELEVFAQLREACGVVSAETVLSGAGLVRLARALDPQRRHPDPETIIANALAHEASALRATALFVRLLGRFAGGLALTFKALGGVYIAGGVAYGLGSLFDDTPFRAAFETHPPYQKLLKSIPTLLVTCAEPGLIGCAAVAQTHGSGKVSG